MTSTQIWVSKKGSNISVTRLHNNLL